MNEVRELLSITRIHSFTLILIGLSILTAHFAELCILLVIVTIHEFGHALMAKHYKWQMSHIVILPFGGEMITDEFGHRPIKEELFVLLAGPLQHLNLLIISQILHQTNLFTGVYFDFFQRFNLIILCTNLLPIWPLDGGKILFLLLSRWMSLMKAHLMILRISMCILVIFILMIHLYGSYRLNSLMFIGFLIFSIWKEYKQRRYFLIRFLLKRKKTEQYEKRLIVSKDEKVIHILEKFYKNRYHAIIVKKGDQVLGVVPEEKALEVYFKNKAPFEPIQNLI